MCRAVAAALALLVPGFAGGAGPVPWTDAGAHVGTIVTVEGDVTAAQTTADGCVLQFSDDPRAFRIVLLVPLLSDLPRQPERLYRGTRVQVRGRVQRFGGRPEMVVRDPDQISIVEPAPAAQAPPPAATPPLPTRTAPDPPPAATPPPPSPAPAAAPSPPARADPPPADACADARRRWQDAAAALGPRAAALERCLRAGAYRCRADAEALAPALAALEWAERQTDAACW